MWCYLRVNDSIPHMEHMGCSFLLWILFEFAIFGRFIRLNLIVGTFRNIHYPKLQIGGWSVPQKPPQMIRLGVMMRSWSTMEISHSVAFQAYFAGRCSLNPETSETLSVVEWSGSNPNSLWSILWGLPWTQHISKSVIMSTWIIQLSQWFILIFRTQLYILYNFTHRHTHIYII